MEVTPCKSIEPSKKQRKKNPIWWVAVFCMHWDITLGYFPFRRKSKSLPCNFSRSLILYGWSHLFYSLYTVWTVCCSIFSTNYINFAWIPQPKLFLELFLYNIMIIFRTKTTLKWLVLQKMLKWLPILLFRSLIIFCTATSKS